MRRMSEQAEPSATDRSDGATSLIGYRLLRRVGIGDRADIFLARAGESAGEAQPGEIVPPAAAAAAAATVALRVYGTDVHDESVAIEIEAMHADTGGALPALVDVATLLDGRTCIAVERITGGSLGRILADRTLAIGEAVTILAALSVAWSALADAGFAHLRWAPGDILLDDAGRPRVVGLGALVRVPSAPGPERTAILRDSHRAFIDLVEAIAAVSTPAGALDPVRAVLDEALDRRPFASCMRDVERMLFAVATPVPVSGVHRPDRSTTSVPTRLITAPTMNEVESTTFGAADAHDSPARPGVSAGVLGVLASLLHLPPALVETTPSDRPSRSVHDDRSVRTRLRRFAHAKRAPLLFGGLVGAGLLIASLAVIAPDVAGVGAADASIRERQGDSAEPAGAADVPVDSSTDGAVHPDLDAISAARELLVRRDGCFDALDLACLTPLLQGGSAIEAEDTRGLLVARDGGELDLVRASELDLERVSVTADMGEAILVAAPFHATERQPALLLLIRNEAGWRLRELFG